MGQHALTWNDSIAPADDAVSDAPQMPSHAPAWLRAIASHRHDRLPHPVRAAVAQLLCDGKRLSLEALLAAPAELERAAQIVVAALDAHTPSLDGERCMRRVAVVVERARARIRCARLGEADIALRLHLILGDLERVASAICRALDGSTIAANLTK